MAKDGAQSRPQSADLIFILAGRENRKLYGLELFQQKLSPTILFSVARFEIRRFSKLPSPAPLDLMKLAADVPPPLRHYFVWFDGQSVEVQYVRPKRFGTLTEIESLARWLHEHSHIQSLLIISSADHLPRIKLCCKSLLPANLTFTLLARPDIAEETRRYRRFTDASIEVMKYLIYSVILTARRVFPVRPSFL